MDTTFSVSTGREAVIQVCKRILAIGAEQSPRGQRTKELLFARITIHDPQDVVADRISRKGLLPAIGYGEALQCVAGVSAPGLMADISSGFPSPSSRWSTDVPTYGERLAQHDQLGAVVRKLLADPDSRQAVALVWRAGDIEDYYRTETDLDGQDRPVLVKSQASNLCTIGLQFLIRGRALHMAAHMRSNDAWHGLPYDLFQFAAVQASVARSLDVEVGTYVHLANSLHLYERHWEQAAALERTDQPARRRPLAVGRYCDDWPTIRERAAKLLRGEALDGLVTESEALYVEALAKYVKED
jgi:thymidylate synthase